MFIVNKKLWLNLLCLAADENKQSIVLPLPLISLSEKQLAIVVTDTESAQVSYWFTFITIQID